MERHTDRDRFLRSPLSFFRREQNMACKLSSVLLIFAYLTEHKGVISPSAPTSQGGFGERWLGRPTCHRGSRLVGRRIVKFQGIICLAGGSGRLLGFQSKTCYLSDVYSKMEQTRLWDSLWPRRYPLPSKKLVSVDVCRATPNNSARMPRAATFL